MIDSCRTYLCTKDKLAEITYDTVLDARFVTLHILFKILLIDIDIGIVPVSTSIFYSS